MKRLAFLALLLLISLASPAFAEENVTELRIDDIATKVDSGSLLEFSFSVGNRVGPACAAQIEYWIGAEAEKIVSGRESIFLNESETKASTASLLVPDEVSGLHSFFIEMQCNDSTVVASKPMKATVPMPTILEFSSLDVSESLEQQLVGFSYIIESNTSPDKPISIQEKILQDNNVLWESSGEAVLAGVRSFERKGPMLPPGNYTLVVEAAYGGKTAVITRQFAVRSTFNIFSLLMLPALILAFAVAFVLAARFFFFGSAVQKAKPVAPAAGEPEFHTKQGLCVVESEASGVLDSSALNQLLDDAGFQEDGKAKAFEVAESVQLIQSVKSCIFTSMHEKMSFETVVRVTISNPSHTDWNNVVVVARIPDFLSGNIDEISSDADMKASETGSAVKFAIARIGALQSASIVYKAGKLISQQEADSISLPAVVSYSIGKALPVKKVKLKKKRKPRAKQAKTLVANSKKDMHKPKQSI